MTDSERLRVIAEHMYYLYGVDRDSDDITYMLDLSNRLAAPAKESDKTSSKMWLGLFLTTLVLIGSCGLWFAWFGGYI